MAKFFAFIVFGVAIPSEVAVELFLISNPYAQVLYGLAVLYTTFMAYKVLRGV